MSSSTTHPVPKILASGDDGVQWELPFIEPRTLPRAQWPWFTLNTKQSGGRLDQRVYRVRQFQWVIEHVRRDRDTYVSQAFFARPNRRAVNVHLITHAYVDLDLYKMPAFDEYSIDQIIGQVLDYCDDEGIPSPSYIVYSGRGIYLKWAWKSPLPKAAVGRFTAVTRELVRRFAWAGADPHAVDVSRILRVVGTINSRSGEPAKVVWVNELDGEPRAYDFDDFADAVLPHTMEEVRQYRECNGHLLILRHEKAKRDASNNRNGAAFSKEDWCWKVVCDVEHLAEVRFPNGIVTEGNRDLFGFVGACMLAQVIPYQELWREIAAWSRKLLPPGYVGSQYRAHASSLLSRARRASAGETIPFDGRQVSPVYTFRKSTLIDWLQVTPGEERELHALISASEKRRRDAEATRAARRAAHTGLGRAEWLARHPDERLRPWEAEGISRRSWYQRKKTSNQELRREVGPKRP